MRTLTRAGLGFSAILTVLALTACGGQGKNDGPASLGGDNKSGQQQAGNDDVPKDPKEALLKYAKCMRENGVDMPDPSDNGAIAAQPEGGADQEKTEKAAGVCRKYLPKSSYNPDDPAEKDKRAKLEKCLREKGIDFKGAEGGSAGIIDGDPAKIEKALKECGAGESTLGAPGK
ncbi:hypothetical protein SAMN04488074_1149 [Lentzea albidocapillata subsp. violacea]|uniref:PT repeat-containing protein n=1 Tax=Lentzea albidocapillata subsp. violacea TaxID=128104 RepID=A0A1G9NFN8_9PSEU|nr:hypothetical protein [Lentzea albidocapillata]SDL85141.1 hypothetical protein SAMN04488074_1149 [Lentzea albidocapillata subsp. violacea]